MEYSSSKKIILGTIVSIVVVLFVIGFSFAFFNYSRLSTTSSTIRTGKLMFGYVEETNGIFLTNVVPVSDERALQMIDKNSYFDFYITYSFPVTSTLYYEIDIEDVSSELSEIQDGSLKRVDSSRVKVALEDRTKVLENPYMVVEPTYFSEIEKVPSSNGKKGYKLYDKTTTGNSMEYYRLYMWIPEYDAFGVGIPLIDVDSVSGIDHQAFSVKINVQSNVKVN